MATFTVRGAENKDVGRAIVRLHPEDMRELQTEVGDILKIAGNKTTCAKVHPSLLQSRERQVIQIDGIIRENAGVSLAEKVRVERIECQKAQKIILTPLGRTFLSQKDSEGVRQSLEARPVCLGDRVRITPFANQYQEFKVTGLVPEEPCSVAPGTRVILAIKEKPFGQRAITYEDIGGLRSEIRKVREMIELPLKHPEVFERVGVEAPKGVLLYGPPGCGKTLIARAVANEVNANFLSISGPEIFVKWVGASAERLRQLFEEARTNAPAIIFIDEIDALAPKRETIDVGGAASEQIKNVVTQLCALMDGLEERGQIIVIGASNLPDVIDSALRRPGRFDREIEIGVPDREGRVEILEIHTRAMPLGRDVDIEKIAAQAHGYVGADLAAVAREAAMNALRRALPEAELSQALIGPEKLETLYVTAKDFEAAAREIRPSALREVYLERPAVSWEDVGGLEDIKQSLQEAVEWPLKYGDLFEHMATPPPKGILLSGPPGCGKTLIAKALARESEVNFISVKGPAVMSKWVGETEKKIREIFHKARQHAPCIIFFDEVDSIASQRGQDPSRVADRALSQLLSEIDGVEELRGVMILAATNRLDMVDPAIVRPGRFDILFEVPLPEEGGRRKIFEVHTRRKPLDREVDLGALAQMTEGCSGADIANVCMRASLLAIREFLEGGSKDVEQCVLHQTHFFRALEAVVASA